MASHNDSTASTLAPIFRFMDLPIDIRIVVYDLLSCPGLPYPARLYPCLDGYNGTDRDLEYELKRYKHSYTKNRENHQILDHTREMLTQTCRQINQEMAPLFFGQYTFTFTDPVQFANNFLNRLSDPKINNLRYLEWRVPYSSRETGEPRSNEKREWELLKQMMKVHKELTSVSVFAIMDKNDAPHRGKTIRRMARGIFKDYSLLEGWAPDGFRLLAFIKNTS